MPTTKKRIYILVFVVFSLVLLWGAILIWDLVGNYGNNKIRHILVRNLCTLS